MTAGDHRLRRAVVFSTGALDGLAGVAARAEQAGFDRVYTTEFLQRDATARALAVGLGTERIGVGTGIAYAFTRPPPAMAALAADVQRLCAGRFALGLGSGTRGIRRQYGRTDIDRAGTWLAGYVSELREALAGIAELAPVGAPPLLGAALNPAMTRLMARACDGVLLHPLALVRRHLHERVLPALAAGAQARGESPAVSAWCITAVGEDGPAARDLARRQVAFYLSTPTYRGVVEDTPWREVASGVREAFDASGRTASWDSLGALIPDELLDEVALAGTPGEVVPRADALQRELGAHGIEELVLHTVGLELDDSAALQSCAAVVAHLAPRVPA